MIDGPTRKQPDIKVTLLGTGGPELTRDRMGAANMLPSCACSSEFFKYKPTITHMPNFSVQEAH